MFFSEPTSDDTVVIAPGSPTLFAIAVAAVVTLFAGVAPSSLLDLAGGSTLFLP